MNKKIFFLNRWFLALLLVVFVAGCGSNTSDPAAASSAKAMTAYSINGSTGTINEAGKTISVTLPYGTNKTALVAIFTATGTSVQVGSTLQTSGAQPANNFTNQVVYRVTAADGTTADYTVSVIVASNSAKTIMTYSLAGQTASSITGTAIAVTMPLSTPSVTALVATFSTSGAGVHVGSALQTSGTTTNDFTSPVVYTVTAADNTTTTYRVTVMVSAAVDNPTAPVLGETGRFVILASQRITTTGVTVISNGDMGIEDQARTYYAGFTTGINPGQYDELINGLSYAHDDIDPALIPAPYASTIAFIDQTRTDLGNAYAYLAADPNPSAATQVCPTELGNLVLTRGVYKTASNVGITTGSLHLDAQGDPNAVFIFSIDGTLTTGAPGGSIVLDNGALAKNVYWRTGGPAYLGAGTSFSGNVFSWTQVNVLAGAAITGRLFGITDQVTLISDLITKAP